MQVKTREAKRSFATDTQMARLATRLMLGETKVDLISDTKDKIHCRKFLEGKGCENILPTEFVILNMEPYKGRNCYYRRQISSNQQTNALE